MAFACLIYHSLADGRFPDTQYPKYTTTRAAFAEHLRALKEDGCRLVKFGDLLNTSSTSYARAEKVCVLTFDDGHKSALDLAGLMSDAGVRGTFFLTMNYCRERADFLKLPEIRELAAAGFDFGTHGASHRALAHMPVAAMRAELSDSKRWLEDVLGKPVQTMSLPAGQGNATVRQAAFELGYQLVGNSVEQLNEDCRPPMEVNRFVVLNGYSGRLVQQIAAGSPAYIWRRKLRAAALAVPKRLLRTYNATRA
jgi:peptidoglycan/xylan/chitin deacetylase (PgdA/CDA1 family)